MPSKKRDELWSGGMVKNSEDECHNLSYRSRSPTTPMIQSEFEREDFFSDALEFLGDRPVIDDSAVCYGPLVLTLARKVRTIFYISSSLHSACSKEKWVQLSNIVIRPKSNNKANTLLADHLFSPALCLAERIERGLLPAEHRTGKHLSHYIFSSV